MRSKRAVKMIPLNDEQRALLKPLLDAVEAANLIGKDAAIMAQVWADGMVATVVVGDEIGGVQAVLKPAQPQRYFSRAADRMRV